MIVEPLEAPSPRVAKCGSRYFGKHLKREVVIAHDELIAGERVERILELGSLRNGKITGIRHSIELTLEKRLTRGLGQKGKRLCQGEGKWRRQQLVVHSNHARSWMLLDSEHRTDARHGGQTVF